MSEYKNTIIEDVKQITETSDLYRQLSTDQKAQLIRLCDIVSKHTIISVKNIINNNLNF